jgi:HAD superfamily hydrolase (TIGR01490 family)
VKSSDITESRGIDFFDVDHTIVNASTSVSFLMALIQQGMISSRILFSIPKFYWQYHVTSINYHQARTSLRALAGIRSEDLLRTGSIVFNQKLQNKIYPGIESIIKNLAAKSRKVVLLTSSFECVIQPIADFLSVPLVIGNGFMLENNVTTGAFCEPFVYGVEKKIRALDLMRNEGVEPTNCSFYTDSHHDLALMEIVGKAVAVNPDMKLKRFAKRRGWEMLSLKLRR